jgi:hypothetical protein
MQLHSEKININAAENSSNNNQGENQAIPAKLFSFFVVLHVSLLYLWETTSAFSLELGFGIDTYPLVDLHQSLTSNGLQEQEVLNYTHFPR